ncbi:MAG TPA: hypothetical protein VGF00_03255 [Acidimicrobiia bacterium]
MAGRRVPGAPVVGELLAERLAGKRPSETGLEDELIEVFRRFGLPQPVRQYVLPLPGGGTARFDAAYPELRLGFEADGDEHHKGLLDRMRTRPGTSSAANSGGASGAMPPMTSANARWGSPRRWLGSWRKPRRREGQGRSLCIVSWSAGPS